jgi:DNA-binding XRE family transcriptional regulator
MGGFMGLQEGRRSRRGASPIFRGRNRAAAGGIRFDLTQVWSKHFQMPLRDILSGLNPELTEVRGFWHQFPGGDVGTMPPMLVVGELARIVRRFSDSDRSRWVASVRRHRPYFLAMIRTSADRELAHRADDLMRHTDFRVAFCRSPVSDASVAGALAGPLRALDPGSVLEVRYLPDLGRLWMTFGDGCAGDLPVHSLGFDDGELEPASAIVSEGRDFIEFARVDGGLARIDAASLRSMVNARLAKSLLIDGLEGDGAVAAALRAARKRQGLTQTQLAERSGFDQAVISRIEQGGQRPRFDTLGRLARGLG